MYSGMLRPVFCTLSLTMWFPFYGPPHMRQFAHGASSGAYL